MHRTGLPAEKPIFQRRHFCPCPPCTTGDFHHCIYKQFLGKYQFYPTFLLYCFFLKCPCGQQLTAITNTLFVGEWHEENMHINYVEQTQKLFYALNMQLISDCSWKKHSERSMDSSLLLYTLMQQYREFRSAMSHVAPVLMMCASVCTYFSLIPKQDSSHPIISTSTLS